MILYIGTKQFAFYNVFPVAVYGSGRGKAQK